MIDYLTNEWAPSLQMADAETIDVNGMEAATGSGPLELKSGLRDVRLVAIRFDADTVFRFIFLTKPEQTAALERDLQETTYSFRRLTPAEAARLASAGHPGGDRACRRQRGRAGRQDAVPRFPRGTLPRPQRPRPGRPADARPARQDHRGVRPAVVA